MRIYKTRKDFTNLKILGNPSVYAGTVCTITDEADNPMYVYQGGTWANIVTGVNLPIGIGGVFTASGTVTYAGGNETITFPNALAGATITLIPQTGAVGVDYSGDGGTTWIAVYGGDVDTDTTITINAIATDIRLRPIASGADIDYSVIAFGSHVSWTGSITYAGGNEIVDLAQTASGVTAYIYPSAGEIGIDYTGDSTVNGSSNWVGVSGGDFSINDSVTFGQAITGVRFRPIASGAAADYLVRV